MTLQDADRMMQYMFEHYRASQRSTCGIIKAKLQELEDVWGSGRVPFSNFTQFSETVGGPVYFDETTEELRKFGALDEADPSNPRVIVPNYVYSDTNCGAQVGLHKVCCADECEAMMAEVERSVAAPAAPAARVAAVVAGLSSDTVEAPRELHHSLIEKLENVAARHGGQVPLHGRLFAQWMHHAFPNECAHPRSNMKALSTPLESLQSQGQDPSNDVPLLPWSEEEEAGGAVFRMSVRQARDAQAPPLGLPMWLGEWSESHAAASATVHGCQLLANSQYGWRP